MTGFKPSHERVSKVGVPRPSYLFDYAGPLSCTVMNVALMFKGLGPPIPFDQAVVPRAGYAYEQATGWQLRTPVL